MTAWVAESGEYEQRGIDFVAASPGAAVNQMNRESGGGWNLHLPVYYCNHDARPGWRVKYWTDWELCEPGRESVTLSPYVIQQ